MFYPFVILTGCRFNSKAILSFSVIIVFCRTFCLNSEDYKKLALWQYYTCGAWFCELCLLSKIVSTFVITAFCDSFVLLFFICFREHPRSQEEWSTLLRQQKTLHEEEVVKWREILHTSVTLLDKVCDPACVIHAGGWGLILVPSAQIKAKTQYLLTW